MNYLNYKSYKTEWKAFFFAAFAFFLLVGGSDLSGNPLISFPAKSLLPSRSWELDGACRYLVYLQDVIYLIMKRKTAAFVANFRQGCNEDVITDVVNALEHLEVRLIIISFYE